MYSYCDKRTRRAIGVSHVQVAIKLASEIVQLLGYVVRVHLFERYFRVLLVSRLILRPINEVHLRFIDDVLLLLKLLLFQFLLLHFLQGLDGLLLFLVDWRFHNFLLDRGSCACSLKLELTIANLSAFLISSRCNNLGVTKYERDLHCLVFDRLEGTTDIDAQLSKLLHRLVINKVDYFIIGAIEYNSHNGLASSHRAVSLDVHLIDTDCLSFGNECVKDILTEVFTFDDDLLLVVMSNRIVGCQSVDTVCLLTDTRSDRARIKTEHASTTNDRDLRSLGHQDG